MAGQLRSPPKEEIGNDGNRGIRVGLEPLNNGILKFGQGTDEGVVTGVADISNILYTGRQQRVWRERED